MYQRLEFVLLAAQPGVNFRELCRRTGISTKTGYKWRERHTMAGAEALVDRSRRPKHSPRQCDPELAGLVVALHRETTWGGRKLRRRLLDLGHSGVPAASTCTEILRRAGCFDQRPQPPPGPCQRFQRAAPNQLLQMDFKGHYLMQNGARCHPFTLLDDHSRFNLALEPAGDQTGLTVRQALTTAFRSYGLPEAILCDNGSPWGASEPACPYTSLTVWLLQLGIRVLHGRPYHPQTQGKEERFHRTLKQELLSQHTWQDLSHCRELFARYRQRYNCERPHDALKGDVPIRHYRPSTRPMPATLAEPQYCSTMQVHRVRRFGVLTFRGQTWYIGRAFAGLPIGLRPSPQSDGQWEVWFAHHPLGLIDLTEPSEPKHKLRSIYQRS